MIGDNKLVIIHYTGTTKEGKVFDTSRDKEPLRYVSNRVPSFIPKIFIESLSHGKKGDIFNLVWPEPFGEYLPYLVQEMNANQLPLDKKVGDMVKAISENYGEVFLIIKEIKDGKAIVDANHPLAGEDLYYEIEIVDIQDKDS